MDGFSKACRTTSDVLKSALQHFDKSDGWAMSSHVALSFMIAIFPFLIFATSMASFFGSDKSTADIVSVVFEYWPEQIAQPIVREIEIVLGQHNVGFLTFGIIFTIYFASNGVEAVRVALNRAYRDEEDRSVVRLRLQSVSIVIIVSVIIIAASVLLTLDLTDQDLPGIGQGLPSQSRRLLITLLMLVAAITSCHAVLPAKRRSLAQVWPGIVTTLILWTLCGRLFAFYVTAVADYSVTYAGLAGVFTALIFLYVMAAVLILGAEINAEIELRKS